MSGNTFTFGMHSGKSFQQVLDNDKWYVSWALKQESQGAIKVKTGVLQRFVDYCRAAGADKENIGKDNMDKENTGKAHLPVNSPTSAPCTPWSQQQATQAEYQPATQHPAAMGHHPGTMPGHYPMGQQAGTMPGHYPMGQQPGTMPGHYAMGQQPGTMPGQYATQGQGMPPNHYGAQYQGGMAPSPGAPQGGYGMAPGGYGMMPQQQAAVAPYGAPAQRQGPPQDLAEAYKSDPNWARVLDHLEDRGIEFEAVRDAHHDTRRDILKAVFFGDPILRAQAETIWLRIRMDKNGQARERSRSRGGGKKKLNFTPCTIATGVQPSMSVRF